MGATLAKCYICDVDLDNENRSYEHIILNAIGGMLKSDKLLCTACNTKMGETADSELAKQFSFLCGYLQIKRDRGNIPTTKGGATKDGTQIHLVEGSTPKLANPIFKVTELDGGGIEYSITARDEKEMRSMLGGLKRKYPLFDVDAAMARANHKAERLKEPVQYEQKFGGDLAFRSLAKTAVNFFILNGGNRQDVKHVFKFLVGNEELDIVKHYHPKKNIYQKEPGEIIHLLHFNGNKREKLLYCYVEFFSTHSYLVLLSTNYEGSDINSTYAYNLITRREVKKDVTFKLKHNAALALPTQFSDFPLVKEKTERLMKIASKIQTDKAISRLTSKAVDETLRRYPEGTLITAAMINEVTQRLAEDYVRFLHGA